MDWTAAFARLRFGDHAANTEHDLAEKGGDQKHDRALYVGAEAGSHSRHPPHDRARKLHVPAKKQGVMPSRLSVSMNRVGHHHRTVYRLHRHVENVVLYRLCGPDAPPPQRTTAYPQTHASTVRGSIRQFNYGHEGEVSGLLLSNGMLVSFPPEAGEQIAAVAKVKSEVIIAGYQRQGATGKTILDAIAITADGQTIAVPVGPAGPRYAPPPPPPPVNGADPGPPQN
jgi:hypothetical protein